VGIEEYNYWNDGRTIASMVPKETVKDGYIIWETEDDEGNSVTHKLQSKWAVCGMCDGDGKHVNPSIDASGLDFYGEPEFEQEYMSGMYDITCNECKGLRVVPVLADTTDLGKQYQQHRRELYDDARQSAQERAMGA